jgi:pimeloyl-ACP methyl ester carboxylesterase
VIFIGQLVLLALFAAVTLLGGLLARFTYRLPTGWWWLARTPLFLVASLVIIVGLFCSVVLVDGWATGRNNGSSKPQFQLVEGARSGRLIIYLPGLGNNGRITAVPLLPTMIKYGDVLVVDYPTQGYDQAELFALLTPQMMGYQGVSFVGFSFGAMTTANYLLQNDGRVTIDGVVLMDPPINWHDVSQPLIRLAPYLRPGWILRKSWASLQRGFLAIQPHAFVEPGHDAALLRRHRDAAANLPVSAYLGQFQQLYYNTWPDDVGTAFELPAAIIDCQGTDVFVKDGSLAKWEQAFKRHVVIAGAQGHAPPVEEPIAVSSAVGDGLSYIYPEVAV